MGRSQKKTIIIFSIIGILFLGICATGFFVWRYKKNLRWKPNILMNDAIAVAKQGDLKRAQVLLKEALEKDPRKVDAHWLMASVSAGLGDTNKAQTHALKAWKGGKKNKETFNFLVRGCGLDTIKDKIEYGRKLITEIIDNKPLQDELSADMSVALKEFDKGLKLYQENYKKHPNSELSLKITTTLMAQKEYEKAVDFIRSARKEKQLNEQGYILLTTLLYLNDPNENLDEIFEEAKLRENYKEALNFQHGTIDVISGNTDKVNKSLLPLILDSGQKPLNGKYAQKSRLFLALMAINKRDKETLDKLLTYATGDDSSLEGERLLYTMLSELVGGKQSDEYSKTLKTISRLLPDEIVVKILKARNDIANNESYKAIEFYESIQNPLYKVWPVIITDWVGALRKEGKTEKALAILSNFHGQRKLFNAQTLILQRDLFYVTNKNKEAQQIQDVLEKQFPDNSQIKMQGAVLESRIGDKGKSDETFNQLIKNNPQNIAIKLTHASTLFQRKEYAKVIDLLKEQNESSQAIGLKALSHIQLKNFKEAEDLFKTGISKYPSEALYRTYVGFLIEQNRKSEIYPIFEKAIELYPKSAWPLLSLASKDLQDKNYEAVISKVKKANNLNANIGQSSKLLAEAYIKLAQYSEAVKTANEGLAQLPGDKDLMAAKGVSLLALNQFAPALEALNTTDWENNALLKSARVRTLLRLNRVEEALPIAKSMYEQNNQDAQAVQLYTASLQSSKPEQALRLIDKHNNLLKKDAFILQKSSLLLRLKQTETARKLLKTGLEFPIVAKRSIFLEAKYGDISQAISDATNSKLTIQEWNALSNMATNKNEHSLSVICLKEALKINPSNPELLNNFAWNSWMAEKRVTSEALSAAKKAVTQLPNNVAVLDTYTLLLVNAKKYSDCIKLLRIPTKRNNADSRLLYWLAKAQEASGQVKLAKQNYLSAMKNQLHTEKWIIEISKEELQKKISSL
ncbi:MAG: hypothetical protein NE330_03585 [Lentisphaeraceae bacterium]|nr:hypothetical protein [Lentisphaeraceae bacterium]